MVKAPLYTRALAYTALQTAFLAFLFSYYDVEIPVPDLTPAKHWLYEKIDDLDWFDFILRFADKVRSVGKKEKSGKTTAGKDTIILSPEQLAKYDGTRGSKGTYLAILGFACFHFAEYVEEYGLFRKVYNVEKGMKHYGPGGGYHFFTGSHSALLSVALTSFRQGWDEGVRFGRFHRSRLDRRCTRTFLPRHARHRRVGQVLCERLRICRFVARFVVCIERCSIVQGTCMVRTTTHVENPRND
jgi:hypothetical protein